MSGARVVLEGAEVERLVALAEVGGEQVAGRAPADQAAVGADAGVVAAECRLADEEGGLLADPATWEAICHIRGPSSCTLT